MDVLVLLASRSGELVTRDEALRVVWGERAIADGPLTKAVSTLRRALGDRSEAPSYIQTIPKRGYRLIKPVVSAPSEPPPGPRPAASPMAVKLAWLARHWRQHRRLGAGLGLGLLLAVLVATAINEYLGQEQAVRSINPPPDRSVAALPFANISPSEEHAAFLAAGLHAELLTQLSKIKSLRVIAATSVIEYAERQTSVSEVAQELGVSAVLQGTVQRVADDLRINVQLIDHNSEQLWAERYQRRLTARNLFEIQGEIATSIAAILNASVNAAELSQLQGLPTQSTQAYNYYLNGVGNLRNKDGPTDPQLAGRQLELAVREDPQFALAWAWLGMAYVGMHVRQAIFEQSNAPGDMAVAAIRRAVDLEPDLPEAHLAMAFYHAHVSFDHQEALREAAIAAARMPGDVLPVELRGSQHMALQQWSQAVAALERAFELDPRNVRTLTMLSRAHMWQRQYAWAESYADRALATRPDAAPALLAKATVAFARDGDVSYMKQLAEGQLLSREWRLIFGWQSAIHERDYALALDFLDRMGPTNPQYTARPVASYYGLTYEMAGSAELAREQFELARMQLEEALVKRPEDPRLLLELAATLPSLGEADQAVALAKHAIANMPRALMGGEELRAAVHWVYLRAGAFDEAIEALDTYLSEPGPMSIEALSASSRFDPIRSDPRFQALVEKYGRECAICGSDPIALAPTSD